MLLQSIPGAERLMLKNLVFTKMTLRSLIGIEAVLTPAKPQWRHRLWIGLMMLPIASMI